MKFFIELYRFSRFHTVIGTTLSLVVLYAIASSYSDSFLADFPLLIGSLMACLGANIYIVGLNQITDIEIDKINKPFLPLASGAFNLSTGYVIIFVSLAIALIGAIYYWPYLFAAIILSLLLGTFYSLPPLRLKRFYFWAAFCIIAVRGLIVNILIFLHFHFTINGREDLTATILLLTAIIFMYSIIIAWFKDMPDTEGDSTYNIQTLSIRLGNTTIRNIGLVLLLVTYAIAIYIFFTAYSGYPRIMGIAMHIMAAIFLVYRSTTVLLHHQKSVKKYYLSIWVLFFWEYVGFGLIGLV